MQNSRFTKAPAGSFRVIEIDENEQENSIVESDYTSVIKDCVSMGEAIELMQKVERPNLLRLAYDENGECVGQHRIGKVAK